MKILEDYSNTYSIVFCNSVPSCDWTARYLESCGIPVVKLHAGINALVIATLCPCVMFFYIKFELILIKLDFLEIFKLLPKTMDYSTGYFVKNDLGRIPHFYTFF